MSELARPIQQLDVVAGEALEAYRYVTRAGMYPAADGDAIFGVTRNAAKVGERVPVTTLGTATVEAAAALAVGVKVMSDTNGKAIAFTSGQEKAGITNEASSADGDFIEVLIERS